MSVRIANTSSPEFLVTSGNATRSIGCRCGAPVFMCSRAYPALLVDCRRLLFLGTRTLTQLGEGSRTTGTLGSTMMTTVTGTRAKISTTFGTPAMGDCKNIGRAAGTVATARTRRCFAGGMGPLFSTGPMGRMVMRGCVTFLKTFNRAARYCGSMHHLGTVNRRCVGLSGPCGFPLHTPCKTSSMDTGPGMRTTFKGNRCMCASPI